MAHAVHSFKKIVPLNNDPVDLGVALILNSDTARHPESIAAEGFTALLNAARNYYAIQAFRFEEEVVTVHASPQW